MLTSDMSNPDKLLTGLNIRHIEIFVRSVMRNPFIFTATDVTELEMKKFIADTIKMVNDVINCGQPRPDKATKFQCRIIDELSDFHENMTIWMNPFTYMVKPNTVEESSF